jgi:hypothetical protein
MIKRNYFTEHKSIITFSAVFVFAFLFCSQAYAIVAPGGPWAGAVATIALGEAIATIALFICIPVALGGFLLRLLGFQKEGEGNGWHWHLKQAVGKLFRYFIYHFFLFGGLVLIAKILQSAINCGYRSYFCNTSNPFNFLAGYATSNILNLVEILLFPTILAIFWTYLIYRVRKNFNPVVIRPSVGSYVRLIFWNFLIIFVSFLFVSTFRFF